MKQVILPSTILEFTWLVIDGFIEENSLSPSPKKEIRSPSEYNLPKKFDIFPGPSYTTQKI